MGIFRSKKVKNQETVNESGFRPKKRLYAIYNGPEGYSGDKENFKKLEEDGELQVGELYVVSKVDIDACFSTISLEGVSNKSLNSVAFNIFSMEKGKLTEYDIFEDKDLNPFVDGLSI